MTLACWLWFQKVDRLLDYTRDSAVEELLAFLVSLVFQSAQRRKTSSAKEGTITIPMNSKKGGFLPCCPATHFTSSGLPPLWLARATPRIQKLISQIFESHLSLSFSLVAWTTWVHFYDNRRQREAGISHTFDHVNRNLWDYSWYIQGWALYSSNANYMVRPMSNLHDRNHNAIFLKSQTAWIFFPIVVWNSTLVASMIYSFSWLKEFSVKNNYRKIL